jgi:hypothetical protein
MEGLASVSQLAPLALSVAPYLVAVHSLHKDADLLDAASGRFLGRRLEGRSGKRAWFTDSLSAAGGVTEVLGEVEAITCDGRTDRAGLPVHRFRAQMQVPLPGWERRKLLIPPFLEVIDRCEGERYAEIILSTPGPFGLLGLAAGKLLGIPVTAVWQEDVPARVRAASGSAALEEMSWMYLRWLFGQADRILVPGPRERDILLARGFDPARLVPAGRSTMAA